MHFETRWRSEDDQWSARGKKITSKDTLGRIQQALIAGPVIVEHWHYRGGSSPTRCVFEDWEDLHDYLKSCAYAGDAIDVWSWVDSCPPDRRLAEGKCPAEDGTVPIKGAY